MRIMTETDLNNSVPNNRKFDFNVLSDDAKQNYLKLSSFYKDIFIRYICNKLNLTYYDEILKNSEYKYIPIGENQMDFYQHSNISYLKYFYIRNNFYVENLNTEELDFLRNLFLSENKKVNSEVIQFLEKTYKKIIFEDALRDGEKCMVFYGPQALSFACPNDSIVIGIRYDEFNYSDMNDEQWDELHENQMIYLNSLIGKMEEEYKKNEFNVKLLKYDDFSINKKNVSLLKK